VVAKTLVIYILEFNMEYVPVVCGTACTAGVHWPRTRRRLFSPKPRQFVYTLPQLPVNSGSNYITGECGVFHTLRSARGECVLRFQH